ncbi:UDP-3-O-acylglucosamine N-acyltransferase [Planctomycetales bacterium]|nr:UDP-3-O-acylglucosamine N-acyltransferase [Planctomycetales bacterium]GHT02849.1 UDP-3-O-acylglucosamine N-acyltransferase [Planctomycetales bacterium]GHV23642.1 UDP-3-O-acylglucosamine N-acyltransferase [Planctomycetales bacterium]
MKLSALAQLVGGELVGDGESEIARVAGLDRAGAGEVSFVAGKKEYAAAKANNPQFAAIGALIVGADFAEATDLALIKAQNPAVAFVLASQQLAPPPLLPKITHPSAVIHEKTKFGKNIKIGANAVVERFVEIGDNTVIGAGAVIGENCRIGADCVIYPNATIYYGCVVGDGCIIHAGAVIGADGFGFQWDGKEHLKIPQTGNVVLGKKVEVGANSTIDRARFGSTTIGDDCKIDNLVHIAHNCQIGAHCVFAGLVGVSGSVQMGEGVICGGQSGFADHLKIGDGVRVLAKSGVMNDMPDGVLCGGEPALEAREGYRQYHNIRYAARHFKDLAKRVEKLENEKAAKDEKSADEK